MHPLQLVEGRKVKTSEKPFAGGDIYFYFFGGGGGYIVGGGVMQL